MDTTYYVELGASAYGIDDIDGGIDTIQFGAGISLQDLYFTTHSNDVQFAFSEYWPSGYIIRNQTTMAPIEYLSFEDGSTYRLKTYAINDVRIETDDTDNVVYIPNTRAGMSFQAGSGNDIIHGSLDGLGPQMGDDTIRAGAGNDIIYGYGGTNDIYGEDGDDIIYGGSSGSNGLNGGAGNDIIYSAHGNYEHIEGGEGNDTIYVGMGNGKDVYGDEGTDLIVSMLNDGSIPAGSPNF